jgi:hypothetical protein
MPELNEWRLEAFLQKKGFFFSLSARCGFEGGNQD